MKRYEQLIVAGVALAALGLSGCGSTRQALGMSKVTPDEFRVVTKAPLVVPPEYALRPPGQGEPQLELDAARNAARAARQNVARSSGEQVLVAKAGADRADPLIAYVVDDQFGDVARKEKGWADRVMFWRDDAPAADAAAAPSAADAAANAELTGGAAVVIERKSTGIKLPGL